MKICKKLAKYFIYFRPNVILGVTNPFFVKTLQHWPHVVRIGDMSSSGYLWLCFTLSTFL